MKEDSMLKTIAIALVASGLVAAPALAAVPAMQTNSAGYATTKHVKHVKHVKHAKHHAKHGKRHIVRHHVKTTKKAG
jgi:hypothetical protein